jgi:hypothetical protein
MPVRLCLGYGYQPCREYVTPPASRCREHAAALERGRRPGARARGYNAEYEANRATVLARSRTCWWCRHDGADQADHYPIPRGRPGANAVGNLRPVHGTAPCPTCATRCNQARGARQQS